MKCKTCGYNSGKKNHSCALQLKRQLKAVIETAETYIAAANEALDHQGVLKTVNMVYSEKYLERAIMNDNNKGDK